MPSGSFFFRAAEGAMHTKQNLASSVGEGYRVSGPLAPTPCPHSCPYYTANVTSNKLSGLSHLRVPPRCWLQWWVAPQESLHEVQTRGERQMRKNKTLFCPWKDKGLREDASRCLASLCHTHSTAQLQGTKRERKGEEGSWHQGPRDPGHLNVLSCPHWEGIS